MTENLDLNKLVADAANGDEAAFAQLYELSVKTAYHTASLMLKNREDAEDVVQNAYMRASLNLSELKNPESFIGWIKTIVENESKNYIKKENRKSLPVIFIGEKHTEFEVDTKPVPDELLDRDELCSSVNKILDGLSPESRACIVLFHYEDRTLNEIAEILDIPLGTVKSRLFKARKQIEKEFSKLRKKDPTLYGVGAIPFILSLWAVQAETASVPSSLATFSAATASQTVTAAAGAGAGAAATGTASTAATATAATATTTAGTATAAAGATASIGLKIAAVAVAGSVAAGGTAAVVNHVKNNDEPTAYSVSSTVLPEETCTVTEYPSQEALMQLTYEETNASETSSSESITASSTAQAAPKTSAAAKTTLPSTTAKATTKAQTTQAPSTKPSTTAKQTTTGQPTTAAPTTNPANNYSASGGVITGYSGTGSSVTVPSTVNSVSVTSIGAGAFSGNTSITSVSLPSSVTQIGQEAFADCTSLKSVSMPSSLELIGMGAFYNCSSLKSVSIPSGTTEIADEAFANCTALTSITIPSSVTTIASDAFDGCDSLTIICSEGSAAHTFAQENSISYTLN